LGAAVGKTMDRFGDHWRNHPEKILRNAWATVAPDDVLLLPGDLSWALKRGGAEPDLRLLASLPGTKVAIKGNHDYWWASGKPLDFPGLLSPPVILDDGALGIAGTRGWFVPEPGAPNESADRKILERERARLRASLSAIAGCSLRLAMTHYPPHPYLTDLRDAGVHAVAYGHLHLGGPTAEEAFVSDGAVVDGVRLFCVSADRVAFTPRQIL
jgi:hypothetical protein